MNQGQKKPAMINQVKSDSLIEQLRDIGQGVSKGVAQDVVKGIGTDALASLFGMPKSGDLKQGQKINLRKPPQPQNMPNEDLGSSAYTEDEEYFDEYETPKKEKYQPAYSPETIALIQQKEQEMGKKIEEIRQELKALIATIKIVDKQISQAVDNPFVDPGIYHLNFLDRLKTILKLMRKNLSDSSSWLSVMRSRKKERRYWAQYKKKGTTFGLSNERNVSTQVG